MSTEMVERVARALMEVRAAPPNCDGTEFCILSDWGFDDLPPDHTQGSADDEITQAAVLKLASSAIDVMRIPSRAMLLAARDWSFRKYGKPIGDDAAVGCWCAMIDAARAE